MATYKVGDLVKVVRDIPRQCPETIGMQGRIIEVTDGTDHWSWDGYIYRLDIFPKGRFHPDELEPVVPPPSLAQEICDAKNLPDFVCPVPEAV